MLRSETLLIVLISTKKKVSVKYCNEHCILDIFYTSALCAFSHLQTSGFKRAATTSISIKIHSLVATVILDISPSIDSLRKEASVPRKKETLCN